MIKKLEQLKKEFESLTIQLKGMDSKDIIYAKVWDQRVNVRFAILAIEENIIKLQINLATALEIGDQDKADMYRQELIDSGLLSTEEIESLTKYV
jgi:hypothetical protein